MGCDSPGTGTRCGELAPERPVLILESDLTAASGLARLGANGCLAEAGDVALGYDPTLASAHGAPYVCDRTAGTCFAIDRSSLRLGPAIKTYAGDDPESNPHDLDVDAEGRLWVTRYAKASLAVIEENGSVGEVDLSSLADADGIPDMEGIAIVGKEAFVSLEKLTDYAPSGPGEIAVIDTETRAVTGSFSLVGMNPFGRMPAVPWDETLRVVTTTGLVAGESAEGSGVEIVDTAARTSKRVLSGEDAGGIVFQAVIAAEDEGYAILGTTDETNATWLVRFDPRTGKVTATLADTRAKGQERGYFYWGLAVDGDLLLMGDRTRDDPSVRAFRRRDGKEIASVAVGLYPPVALLAE